MIFDNILNRLRIKNVDNSASVSDSKRQATNVVIDDEKLLLTLGQWLDVLDSRTVYSCADFSVSVPLSVDKLMVTITEEQKDEILQKFSTLLHMSGVNAACHLSNLDQNMHFKGQVPSLQQDIDLAIRWGDWMDFGPELHVDFGDIKRVYDFYGFSDEDVVPLVLSQYVRRNQENGNFVSRYLSPYSYSVALHHGDSCLNISVERPKKCDDEIFYLENEGAFENYLLGLTFPVAIDEVFKKFSSLCLVKRSSYPKIQLRVEKTINDGKTDVTDNIDLNYGQVASLMVTRDGKTISLDGNNSWSYRDSDLSVSRDSSSGKLDICASGVKDSTLLQAQQTVIAQINEAAEEVEMVRKLRRKLLEKKDFES